MADIKVMLADGHALVRAGVRRLLEEDEEIEVSEEARDGMECLDRMCAFAGGNEGFRILLLEIGLGMTDGLQVLKKAKETLPGMKVMFLTGREDSECLARAMEMGADGYLSKDCDISELKTAIRTILYGKTYIQTRLKPLLRRREAESFGGDGSCKRRWESLTAREREVLAQVAEGMLNKEIAFSLNISEQTVKNHLSSIFRKLDVTDRTQAAILAIRESE